MSSKLSKLISYYEAERSQLLAHIADFVAESEYSFAHRHFKALRMVEKKLRTYYNLADPFYDEKTSIIDRIERIKECIETETSKFILSHYLETILQEQQRLDELNQAPVATPNESKKSALQDALFKLLERKISEFTLVISESEGIYCNVQLVRRTLIITFPQIQRLITNYVLRKKQIKYFQGLGFRLYDFKDKLILFLPYSAKQDIFTVKTILARIIFDVFSFQEFRENMYIKHVKSI